MFAPSVRETNCFVSSLRHASPCQEREFDACCSSSSSLCSSLSDCAWALPATEHGAGLWGLLPEELIESILSSCSPSKLAMLQSTCRFFRQSAVIERIAKQSLKSVPRARSLKPSASEHETYLALLQFINHQSAAAAQATAIACGSHHTTALLVAQDGLSGSQCSSSNSGSSDDSSRSTCTMCSLHTACSGACSTSTRTSTSTSTSASSHTARRDQRKASTRQHVLCTFGRNMHGQLGCGDHQDRAHPAQVQLGFQPCVDNAAMEEEIIPAVVSCGSQYSMAMSRRGELYSWGLGRSGELAQGPWVQLGAPEPRQAQLLQRVRVVSIACGASHTLAIAESGALWSCGSNRRGQLGTGTLSGSCNLQMVHNLPRTRIVSAAAGAAHSVALASDGSLYTWGDGSYGQLGHEQLQVMAAPHSHNTIILPLPQKVASLNPATLAPENRVTAVSAGSQHTMVLLVGGGILAFGSNESGCLGLGDTLTRWSPTRVPLALPGEEGLCIRAVQLSCGGFHTLALLSRQGCLEVRAAGANNWGQLGTGDGLPRCRLAPTVHISRPCAVQAGAEHSAAISDDGSVFTWGRGDSGQLGHGDELSRCVPTCIAGFMAVHPDKTLRRSKRDLPAVRPVVQVQAGVPSPAKEWTPLQ